MFSFEMYDLTVDSAMMIVQGVDYSKDKQKPLQYEVSFFQYLFYTSTFGLDPCFSG